MGKHRTHDKDYSEIQKLRHENTKLKGQVSSLRKQLARIDLDRFSYVKDIVEEHLAEQTIANGEFDVVAEQKKAWACHNCPDGHLEILLYSRAGELWYFRRCSNNSCAKRTKSQIYTAAVRGIRKETEELTPKR